MIGKARQTGRQESKGLGGGGFNLYPHFNPQGLVMKGQKVKNLDNGRTGEVVRVAFGRAQIRYQDGRIWWEERTKLRIVFDRFASNEPGGC